MLHVIHSYGDAATAEAAATASAAERTYASRTSATPQMRRFFLSSRPKDFWRSVFAGILDKKDQES
jgi:hypothetical protein